MNSIRLCFSIGDFSWRYNAVNWRVFCVRNKSISHSRSISESRNAFSESIWNSFESLLTFVTNPFDWSAQSIEYFLHSIALLLTQQFLAFRTNFIYQFNFVFKELLECSGSRCIIAMMKTVNAHSLRWKRRETFTFLFQFSGECKLPQSLSIFAHSQGAFRNRFWFAVILSLCIYTWICQGSSVHEPFGVCLLLTVFLWKRSMIVDERARNWRHEYYRHSRADFFINRCHRHRRKFRWIKMILFNSLFWISS